MNTNLKQLKERKGQKQSYEFIQPISQYISENYGEIEDLLDSSNIDEILREISISLKDKGITNQRFCVYSDLVNLEFIRIPHIRINKDKDGLDRFYGDIRYNEKHSLNDIYYVTDVDGLMEFNEINQQVAVANRIKRDEEIIEKDKEEELKRQERIVEDIALRKEFALKADDSTEKARLFKQLFSDGNIVDRYKAFTSIVDSDIDRDLIYEIARDVVNDHEYDCH